MNPDLIKSIGEAVAKEVLSTGIPWTFAPTIAVPQNDLWGRTYEGYSENPELVSLLGEGNDSWSSGRG
jgi:beta-glucosidase